MSIKASVEKEGISCPLYKNKEPDQQYIYQTNAYLGMNWEKRNEDVKLSNDLRHLRQELKELTRIHDKAEKKIIDLEQQLRITRHDLEDKNKQVEGAKRMIDRLSDERKTLEGNLAICKSYCRKLECKFIRLTKKSDISVKYDLLKNKVVKLENALSSSEKDVKYYQDICKSKDGIISNLQKSLKIEDNHQLNSNTSELIDTIVEGEVECEELDKKLVNATNDIKELNDKLEETKKIKDGIRSGEDKKWKISITNEIFNKEVEEDKVIQKMNVNWDEREKQLKENYVSFINKINDMEDYLEVCNFKNESDNSDENDNFIKKSLDEVIYVKSDSELCDQIKVMKDEYIRDI